MKYMSALYDPITKTHRTCQRQPSAANIKKETGHKHTKKTRVLSKTLHYGMTIYLNLWKYGGEKWVYIKYVLIRQSGSPGQYELWAGSWIQQLQTITDTVLECPYR